MLIKYWKFAFVFFISTSVFQDAAQIYPSHFEKKERKCIKCMILTPGRWTKVNIQLQTAPYGGGVSSALQHPSILIHRTVLVPFLSISCNITAGNTTPQR